MVTHVLLYTDEPGIGGVAQYNHSILLGLGARGYRVTCVQSRVTNPLIAQQQQQGIHHEWLDFDTIQQFDRTFHHLNDARTIFERIQPDLILFSDGCPTSNFAAKQVALELAIPYLVVVGFAAPYLAERFAFCLEELSYRYNRAKAVIAVSQENLDVLRCHFQLPAYQGEVIYYGRPDAYFQPKRPDVRDRLRQEIGVPADGVLCLTAARLEGLKGFQYQLEAIVELRDLPIWESLYFAWAGEGAERETIEAAIHGIGLGDRVTLLGYRWDVIDWYDAADIFVFPSELEGMPLAVMEAMAKGLPVIATAVSGIPEELGDTGRLLSDPKHNPQATVRELVDTLHQWAADPDLRRAIAQAGKQRAEHWFREDRMVAQTLQVIERSLLPRGDYVSPGLAIVRPDAAFPNMVVGDPQTCPWEHLRRSIPHNWYVDRRNQMVGFLSRDEAQILYNNALQFQGKPALEIGCWMGWSACHLALAGVVLDVVDPLLATPEVYASVSQSLQAAGVMDRVNLVAGYSPQAVRDLATQIQRHWSLIFIDGDHESPGPLQDAIACEPLAAADALILFHDLAAPDVAAGLAYFRQQGWQTLVYQTMQIMGVAWRGAVTPVYHQPDPSVSWELPVYLSDYPVSGSSSQVVAPSNLYSPAPVRPATPTPGQGGESSSLTWLVTGLQQISTTCPSPPTSPLDRLQLQAGLQQGEQQYVQHQVEAAIATYQAILTIHPGSAIAHQRLTHLYRQQGNVQNSLTHHVWAHHAYQWTMDAANPEFQELLAVVRPYTLLSEARLLSLYRLAIQICLDDVPGNFVECGTFKGGAAAVLAIAIQRYSLRSRRLYACDTFEGMPDPTEVDTHQGIPANLTGFGAGTLQAPMAENLAVICQQLNIQDIVIPVKGLFAETLPAARIEMGAIAFLHADGDWYESTLDIFRNLYDQVVPQGVIQVDDYGHWDGCRQALHEFERQRQESFALQRIDETGVWFGKTAGISLDCQYWRTVWQLAQLAEGLGHSPEAIDLTRTVLHILPNLLTARELLQRLEPDTSDPQEAIATTMPLPVLLPDLNLRTVNVLVSPNWHQPEEDLLTELVTVLQMVLQRGDRADVTLLIDHSGMDAEAADLTISAALLHLVSETNLDISEGEPEIALISNLSPAQWQALAPYLTDLSLD